jgi:hypothetical protein
MLANPAPKDKGRRRLPRIARSRVVTARWSPIVRTERRATLRTRSRWGRSTGVNRLVAYLREHVFVDFQGDLTAEKLRELLAGDDSRDARAILARVARDRGTDDMMVALADCLLEVVQAALTDEVLREQLRAYADA